MSNENEKEQKFALEEAVEIGDELGIDWGKIGRRQFRRGMDVELEHGKIDPKTDVSNDDPLTTGKIALAHLNEFPDYYDRLDKMEEEAEEHWKSHRTVKWKEIDISDGLENDLDEDKPANS